MQTNPLSLPLTLLATAFCSSIMAATLGPLEGGTAAQAPLGGDITSRFATDSLDETLLGAFASGASGALRVLDSSVTIQFLGTGAAREARLLMDGSELFQTRAGCSFATALADDFCTIDTIGLTRRISGLTPGQTLALTLDAAPQGLGPAASQRPWAETFDNLVHARYVDLGGGQLLLGFEEGSDASFGDMVFLLNGVTVAGVPEPAPGLLLALGLLTLALRRHQRA